MHTTFDTLDGWLRHCERLHPLEIDMDLARVQAVARRMALRLDCAVVTVAGTNGKGSSCALLEAIAQQAGYRSGVYSSPHLLRFEERCRIDGASVAGADLLPHFEAVESARLQPGAAPLALTWFEFTTLAILRLLAGARLDLAILEVGLGGRLDATNVIDADCALITSIDIDHQHYLGADRESIGREKAGIMRAGHPAVVSDPAPPASLAGHAQRIGADLWLAGRDFGFSGDRQQWNWSGRSQRWAALAYPALRGANQLVNASGVLAVFEALRARLPVSAQALRGGLAQVALPGRFQIVPGQPVLVLDVAHNRHAVAALAANLDAMGYFPATHAVFGAMADKDTAAMLAAMAPLVGHWYFTDLPGTRAASAGALQRQWGALPRPPGARRASASVHASPMQALQAAAAAASTADRIAVFGSFHTVGGVLTDGTPHLARLAQLARPARPTVQAASSGRA